MVSNIHSPDDVHLVANSMGNALKHYKTWEVLSTALIACHNIISVHFNHFYCTEVCDKLEEIYIYLNVDDC